MAPIEIRPIYAEDLPGLLRHVQAPVQVPVQVPVQAPVQAPAPGADFAANTDGPWPRSPEEFRVETARLTAERVDLAQIRAANPDQPPTTRLAYAEGVRATARWTLALTPKTPVTFVPLTVSDTGIRGEIEIARYLISEDDSQLRIAYAQGVLAWFAWLATANDTIAYLR